MQKNCKLKHYEAISIRPWCGVYVILDRGLLHKQSLIGVAEELAACGVEVIQYRDKLSPVAEVRTNSILLKRI